MDPAARGVSECRIKAGARLHCRREVVGQPHAVLLARISQHGEKRIEASDQCRVKHSTHPNHDHVRSHRPGQVNSQGRPSLGRGLLKTGPG
jgi:hypothetical protein